VFYTSVASINTPDCLYHQAPLSGRRRVGRSLRPRRPTGRPSFTARLVVARDTTVTALYSVAQQRLEISAVTFLAYATELQWFVTESYYQRYTTAQVMSKCCACNFLYGATTSSEDINKLENALETQIEFKTEAEFYRKNGQLVTSFCLLCTVDCFVVQWNKSMYSWTLVAQCHGVISPPINNWKQKLNIYRWCTWLFASRAAAGFYGTNVQIFGGSR